MLWQRKSSESKEEYRMVIPPPSRACLREHLEKIELPRGIWKRARISKSVIPLQTGNNGWILVKSLSQNSLMGTYSQFISQTFWTKHLRLRMSIDLLMGA